MEVTINELRDTLQKDNIFTQYFNAFLSLPNFSKRLTYCADTDSFDIHPKVDTELYMVNSENVLNWAYSSRLPLFFTSELFYEFKLCQALTDQNEGLQDENKDILSSVTSMYNFKKFLFQTEGECACLFWMDVERLKWNSQSHTQSRKLIIRINEMYVSDNAPFQLQQAYRECLTSMDTSGSCSPLQKWSMSYKQQIKELVKCQEQVIQCLRNYWCKRYVTRIEEERVKSGGRRKKFKFSQLSVSMDKETVKKPEGFPAVVINKESGMDTVTKKASHIKLSNSHTKLVQLSNERRNVLTHAVSNDSIAKIAILSRNTPTILLSSSTCSLFSAPITPGVRHSLNSEKRRDIYLEPYLTASLRADFIAGNSFLKYLKKSSPNPRAVNFLLFWQSVENILMQDEMKRWFTASCTDLEETSSSDKDSPYLSYFETYFVAKDLQELCLFFLQPKAIHRILLPAGVEEELGMLLPKGLGHGLLLATQDYAKNSLLKPWMDYLQLDYNQFIKSSVTPRLYRKLSPSFNTAYMKQTVSESLTPEEVAYETYTTSRSSPLDSMWDSLKFSEAIKYAGVHQLPSRNVIERSSPHDLGPDLSGEHFVDEMEAWDMSQNGEDEGGGIFLNPMITTLEDEMTWDMERHIHKRTLKFTTSPPNFDFKGKKLEAPKDMIEILNDKAHLDYFRDFMVRRGCTQEDRPIEFWFAVEDLKGSVNEKKKHQSKLKKIKNRFLSVDAIKLLKLTDQPLEEEIIKKGDNVELSHCLDAQDNVRSAMEEKWLDIYTDHFSIEEVKKVVVKEKKWVNKKLEMLRQKKTEELTKYRVRLWKLFAQKVLKFKRAMMNPVTIALFRKYLGNQMLREDETNPAIKCSKTQRSKYKALVGDMKETEKFGTHTPEDYITVFKKAHAIINCYIDSRMDPRVQINISFGAAKRILDNVAGGKMTFGLFHEASMSCFHVLIPHWRKFCVERALDSKKKLDLMTKRDPYVKKTTQAENATVGRDNIVARRFLDGGPILSFSLRYGLRWIYPSGRYVRIPCSPLKPTTVSLKTFQPLKMQKSSITTIHGQPLSSLSVPATTEATPAPN